MLYPPEEHGFFYIASLPEKRFFAGTASQSCRKRSNTCAVRKENRRCAADIEPLAQCADPLIREGTVVSGLYRHFVIDHPVTPCLCGIGGAPDVSGNLDGFF